MNSMYALYDGMLNEEEKKLIRKYYLLPGLAITSLIMLFGISGLWIALVMVDDIVFHSRSFHVAGMCVYLLFMLFYVVVLVYAVLTPQMGKRTKPWTDIVDKLFLWQSDGDRYAPDGGYTDVSGSEEMSGTMDYGRYHDVRYVAEAYGMDLPRTVNYILPLIILPVALLTAVYVPEYLDAAGTMRNERATASAAIAELRSVFEEECDYVSADDPMEYYGEYGYYVFAYLDDFDAPYMSYLTVRVGNDGIISEVSYHTDINVNVSKEENLKKVEEDTKRLHDMLIRAKVEASSPVLFSRYTLTEDFIELFRKGSYYDDFHMNKREEDGVDVYMSYETEAQEDYDEYSSSYIYMYIDQE